MHHERCVIPIVTDGNRKTKRKLSVREQPEGWLPPVATRFVLRSVHRVSHFEPLSSLRYSSHHLLLLFSYIGFQSHRVSPSFRETRLSPINDLNTHSVCCAFCVCVNWWLFFFSTSRLHLSAYIKYTIYAASYDSSTLYTLYIILFVNQD